ncbi:hypothetical protein GWK47_007698 [Chionoecetes opilio]|uniref:Gag-like protein n=1 Tax=Chionoecetes opilio TaxID=41210 RepID=A0A8J5CA43_CHIOP|nr:hypothetical protein GWK47_007698 [Chionoecetes opilio]
MSDTSPGTEPAMDVQEDEASCPPLPSASKRARAPSPSQEGPDKAPRTDSDTLSSQVAYVQASYLLRAASGARVFANPCRVSHALHLSTLGKYVLEGETRALGNGCALVVVIWEHNIPKVPELGQASFTLGEWEVTCRRAEREGPDYHYARVGPLDDSTDITEVRRDFRSFDGGEVVEITWIPAHNLPRYTTGKWLRLKVSGTLPTKVSISQLVYWARPYLLPLLRCSGCHRIGHSLNTCRSPVRCSRCSGPHPCRQDDITCTRPFRCFQCGGPHGPRSAHCTFNCRAQQLYADLAREGTPLHAINTQLRDLDLLAFRPSAGHNHHQPSLHQLHLLYPQLRRSTQVCRIPPSPQGIGTARCRRPRKMMPPCLRLPSSTLNPAALLLLCAVASACVNLVDRPDIRPLRLHPPPQISSLNSPTPPSRLKCTGRTVRHPTVGRNQDVPFAMPLL